MDCSSHGHCDDGKCVCESERYGGEHCEVDCGEHATSTSGTACECAPGLGPPWRPGGGGSVCAWQVPCTAEQLKYAKDSGDAAACGGAHFPGSRLLTKGWGDELSAGFLAAIASEAAEQRSQ